MNCPDCSTLIKNNESCCPTCGKSLPKADRRKRKVRLQKEEATYNSSEPPSKLEHREEKQESGSGIAGEAHASPANNTNLIEDSARQKESQNDTILEKDEIDRAETTALQQKEDISALRPLAERISEIPTVFVSEQELSREANRIQAAAHPIKEDEHISEQPVLSAQADSEQTYDKAGQTTEEMDQPVVHELPTVPVLLRSIPHPELFDDDPIKRSDDKLLLSTQDQSEPLLEYKFAATMKGSQMFPTIVNPTNQRQRRRRGGCLGCFSGCLVAFLILLILIGAAWFFAGRPYAHGIAEAKINTALTDVTNLPLSSQIQSLPAGSTLPIQANTINNLIVAGNSPSSPLQKPTTTITPQGISLNFQLYGYPGSISFTPTDQNGKIVAQNVSTGGIFSLIMSSEEMQSLLNAHLSAAQDKLGRSVTGVKLKNQEVDVTIG